jgi:hypothetical protein
MAIKAWLRPVLQSLPDPVEQQVRQLAAMLRGSFRKDGLPFVPAAEVVVGDKLFIRSGFAKLHDHNIVFWRPSENRTATDRLARHVYETAGIARNRHFALTEKDRAGVAVGDMYQFVHRLQRSVRPVPLSQARNTLVAVDPSTALPILLRMAWPETRIVCVFTRETAIPVRYLREIDCVIASETAFAQFAGLRCVPVLLPAPEIDDSVAHIRAFYSTRAEPSLNYHLSMRAKTHTTMGDAACKNADLIFVGPGCSDETLRGLRSFREYVACLIESSDDILLHSRWIYQMESLIDEGRWPEMVLRVCELGGRITTAEA